MRNGCKASGAASVAKLVATLLAVACCLPKPVAAQPHARVLEIAYTPVARAQVAIWLEDAEGRFLGTVALTEAVAYRGIGNRPGASQINSGYRYPWGRREGVLPIWAHRRAAAEGARLFPRVVFQQRSEGWAAREVNDFSPDDYFCLQNDQEKSKRDALDAVSCATVFNSDKGRYLTQQDVAGGYAEPWQFGAEPEGVMQPLPLLSLYPPRMDAERCVADGCIDHPDVARFAGDARAVMPEIDAVTRATAAGGVPQQVLFRVPDEWPEGEYALWLEINVEGDYNEYWNDLTFPTPEAPVQQWDDFARLWGYPYRGQPSIAFQLRFTLAGEDERVFATAEPAGRSSWQHWEENYGALQPVEVARDAPERISNDNGSGVDRLQADADGARLRVTLRPSSEELDDAVGPVTGLEASLHEDPLRSHEWVRLRFAAADAKRGVHDYQVRVARQPIVDEATFIQHGRPAKAAAEGPEGATELEVPPRLPAGEPIEVVVGNLVASTRYHIGVRAQDDLGNLGPLRVTEVTTAERNFATVSPCFVATVAYGSPLAHEVSLLRRFRDRHLSPHGPGRALVGLYDRYGPVAARLVARSHRLRELVRVPLAWLAALLE